MTAEIRCEVCGKAEREEYDLDIWHRGCRLRAAFPDAVTEQGGLVALDMSKLAALIANPKVITRDGVAFERWSGGRVSVSVRVQVANSISDWSWWISPDEWRAIVAALAQEGGEGSEAGK